MPLKERIARLFGRGKQEKRTFVISFRHSQKNAEFESTWDEVRHLSRRFGGERGLKMDNFFVPWSEVASIYEKDPEENEAHKAGAKVMVVTKLRIGDANTMMAEGGIQAADKPNDSPAIHFLDAFGGLRETGISLSFRHLCFDFDAEITRKFCCGSSRS